MIIKYIDNKGSKDTLYFNPSVVEYEGGIAFSETVAYKKGVRYDLPPYAIDGVEVWVDLEKRVYYDKLPPNTGNKYNGVFKVCRIVNETAYVIRYKELNWRERIYNVFA